MRSGSSPACSSGCDLGDLGDHVVDLAAGPLGQDGALVGDPECLGDLQDDLVDVVHVAVGVDDQHRDPRVTHLQDHVPRAEAAVGDDQRRGQLQDRLAIELVTVRGHQGAVGDLLVGRGRVPPDQVVAEPQLEDDARARAVDVQRQDPAGVGDGDLGPLRVGHRHRQVLLGVVGDGADPGLGQQRRRGTHIVVGVTQDSRLGQRRAGLGLRRVAPQSRAARGEQAQHRGDRGRHEPTVRGPGPGPGPPPALLDGAHTAISVGVGKRRPRAVNTAALSRNAIRDSSTTRARSRGLHGAVSRARR